MIEIEKYKVTCQACPFQVEGELSNGQHFYFRYRFSRLWIGVGATNDEAIHHAMEAPWKDRREEEGDSLSGVLFRKEFLEFMSEYLKEYDENQ